MNSRATRLPAPSVLQRLWLFVFALNVLFISAQAQTAPRGGRVGWARIITSSQFWDRHAQSDSVLTRFIREETSLNIDPTWYSADPENLDQLCRYPLLYTNNLTDVEGAAKQKNLAEYLRRGGFIFIDACSNHAVTRDPDEFLRKHIALMHAIAPQAEVRKIPANHEIYRQYFVMKETPPHSYMSGAYDPRWAKHGFYGLYQDDRLIALISLSGLQCGWDGHFTVEHAENCMKMVVNIYVYAMMR